MIANRWKDATSEFARADLEKVWDKVAKTKATLSSSIQNWERSGQRDGCRIDEDDGDEEEPGGGSRDSSVEGVAKTRENTSGVVPEGDKEHSIALRTRSQCSPR